MINQEKFAEFLDVLLDDAMEDFYKTLQGQKLNEKLARMDEECDCELMPDQKDFAVKCFATLRETADWQGQYLYRRGMQDCVKILKHLGVLA